MTSELTADPTDRRARWLGLLVFLAIAFAAGGIGSLLQGNDVDVRYLELDRPAWAPPSWAFGVVWPVLYALIGIGAWRVWRTAGGVTPARTAVTLWLAQLLVNAVWPWVFFGIEAFGPAVAVIVVLVALVVATVVAFHRWDGLAAWLFVPYLLWITYATALNVAIWQLN